MKLAFNVYRHINYPDRYSSHVEVYVWINDVCKLGHILYDPVELDVMDYFLIGFPNVGSVIVEELEAILMVMKSFNER